MNTPAFSTMQAMHNASTLLQAGKFAQARSVLDAILRSEPNMVEAHRLLAGALQALGDKAGAESALRTAIAINPRWAPAQVALGEQLAEDGRLGEAESALRQAFAQGNNYPRAALSLARLLLQTGRAQEAHDVIAPFAESANADTEMVVEYARALLVLKRHDPAIDACRRVVRALPASGIAELRLAAALTDARHFADAAKSAQRSLEKGVDLAQTWFIIGSAAMGEDRYEDAEAAFRAACKRDPNYVDAQRELAQIIWMRTANLDAATAQIDAQLQLLPNAQDLLTIKAKMYQSAGDDAGALALLAEAASDDAASPMLLLTASESAIKSDASQAIALARRALNKMPRDPLALGMLGNALLHAGRAQEAEQLALQTLTQRPDDQGFIALLASARRLRGDTSYREIHDYAGLVHGWIIDTPPGWPSLASYLADLATSLRRLHTLRTHPVRQSLRHGTQTTRNLLESDDAAIQAFFHAIDGPIHRHMAAIGHGNDPTRRRNTGRYKIHGIWSVQLHPNGYHTNHVHPEGWLSSACYIDLPPAIEHGHEGWLAFGEPGVATEPPLPPEHFVQPAPGLLALFPSHMWHGTLPFSGEATRLTIAFDLVPG